MVSQWSLLQPCMGGEPAWLWTKHAPSFAEEHGKEVRQERVPALYCHKIQHKVPRTSTRCRQIKEKEEEQVGSLLMAQAASALLVLRRGGAEGTGPMQGHLAPHSKWH